MDYETVIREKFPNCDVEVIAPDFFELNKLIEYITDDIIIIKPQSNSISPYDKIFKGCKQ